MKKVLILIGRYLPGYKDGGPVRTIKNLTDSLGDEYQFYILTNDRDRGDNTPYLDIQYETWNDVGKAKVCYVKPNGFKLNLIKTLSENVDIVYCCGPYDNYAIKAMLLKKLNIIKKPLVIASMGSFSKGALGIHSVKKKTFIKIMKFLGLFKNIIWSVTSVVEEGELKATIGKKVICMIAEDLPRNISIKHVHQKKKNELKIIFLSRICEMKNLLFAIQILKKVNKKVIFDIYGNIEDPIYWKKCKNELKNSLIEWHYKGECDSEKVPETFANYDVFLFPTLGENFGHVIGEALLGGCIPIISDRTPWSDLEKNNCGKVIFINDESEYVKAINYYYSLDNSEFKQNSIVAQTYIYKKNINSIEHTGYLEIFNYGATNND